MIVKSLVNIKQADNPESLSYSNQTPVSKLGFFSRALQSRLFIGVPAFSPCVFVFSSLLQSSVQSSQKRVKFIHNE